MDAQSKAWKRVGELFEKLGKQVGEHLTDLSAEAEAERVAIEKSFRAVVEAFEDVVESAGNTVRDPALRKDFGKLAEAVRAALAATYETATAQAQSRLRRPIRKVKAVAAPKKTGKAAAPKQVTARSAKTRPRSGAKATGHVAPATKRASR